MNEVSLKVKINNRTLVDLNVLANYFNSSTSKYDILRKEDMVNYSNKNKVAY